ALAFDHSGTNGVHGVNVREVLCVHALLPGVRVQLLPWKTPGCACAINKDVDWSQKFFGLTRGVVRIFRDRKVRADRNNIELFLRKSAARRFEIVLAPRSNRNTRAFLGKGPCARQSNALTSASYEDDFPFQTKLHL